MADGRDRDYDGTDEILCREEFEKWKALRGKQLNPPPGSKKDKQSSTPPQLRRVGMTMTIMAATHIPMEPCRPNTPPANPNPTGPPARRSTSRAVGSESFGIPSPIYFDNHGISRPTQDSDSDSGP